MPGALELAAGDEGNVSAGAPPGGGALSLAAGRDPFDDAVSDLNLQGMSSGKTSPIDVFSQRARGAYPSTSEIRAAIEQAHKAGDDALSFYRRQPINKGLPWLQFAAGMLKPTKTGSFGESLGYGLEGYAGGMQKQNEQELSLGHDEAKFRTELANSNVSHLEELARIGQSGEQIQAQLALARERMRTEAEKFAIANGGMPGTPDFARLLGVYEMMKGLTGDQLVSAHATFGANPRITPEQLSDTLLAQKDEKDARTVAAARGVTFRDPAAEAAYVAQYVSEQKKLRDQSKNSAGAQAPGAPGAGGAAAPAGNGLPVPVAAPAPAAAPGGAGAAAAPAAGGPAGARPSAPAEPYAPFLKGPSFEQPAVMGAVDKELFVDRAKKREDTAREYEKSVVLPQAADASDARGAIAAQAAILKKDPNLTGAGKDYFFHAASFLASMGLADKQLAERVTNAQEFDSFVKKSMLGEQTRQHGVQTEGDASRILQAIQSMGKTPEANHFILRYLDAVASRAQERQKFFQDYEAANHGSLAGADKQWFRYLYANPLIKEVQGSKGPVTMFDPEYRRWQQSLGGS